MRLWSLHPQYLDSQGLVGLWREALLAQAVLKEETQGYRNHPQLDRFKNYSKPLLAISLYLKEVYAESKSRDFNFDGSKFQSVETDITLSVTTGQIEYEWNHLLKKLKNRSPELYQKLLPTDIPKSHPLFKVKAGDIELWEKQ